MSFFNDLGKKISDTTHNVVEKTKTSTDTMRLNGLINDEERNINGAYLNIGKKYVELHAENAEPEFTEYLSAIIASQKKIEEYREQIRKNKHLLICQSCGEEIPETVLFCTKCGAENPVGKRLAEERAAQEAAERAAREAAAAAQQAAAQQAAMQQQYVQTPQNAGNAPAAEFCTSCGKPRMAGAMFCTGCGTRFVPAENPVPSEPVVSPIPAPVVPKKESTETTPIPENTESEKNESVSTNTEENVENTSEAAVNENVTVSDVTETAVEQTQESVSEVKPEKICAVCGRTVPEKNRFCTNCGTKVAE